MKLIDICEKSFNDIFHEKNKWIKLLQNKDKKEVQENLFVLIDNAYGPIGGHPRIKNEQDILDPQLTHWQAIDNDNDPEADVVLFGRKTKHGIKVSGWGHDGKKNSRSDLMNQAAMQLNKKGYWIEAGDRPAKIFIGKDVPIIKDQETIEELLGKPVKMQEDGWYIRTVGGSSRKKILFGVI